ncbi:putative transcription factor interactor and regulator CCHC(Zn) family [Helianthus annuus]|uniref:Transcription factor interactor and regulator CCHC(Zn) family n=1 Tax=Helianthus annuus TaxID=4232 RepID=A0A9K3I9A8_HELAN|nr:putative transcription factor interactor and regulator CCHC(Zn) family [Helianthus annuus]KAJ0526952.1 putative transcription factor interactor and regulator CCHC(Zn) family [Helianthus annuus]KAJ0535526.1 putative transcription factor interactor and regulator CCHC(Zn) family [Helianthus annuus]KAJ0543346.1 putative transcription factor interactor and regulator CCHC(Zn) family [Helianthus annuus]KAJ0708410.1 putative transcription factor interactor and regulator CCHC(Zn) family [Helianthus a
MRKNNSQRRWKFLNKKSKRVRNTNRCYVCNKEGHFAKDCKDKRKTQALLEAINKIEPVDISDIESLYSLDDEPRKRMICTISYSSSDESETSETSESEEEPLQIYMMEEVPQNTHDYQSPTPTMYWKRQKSQKHKQCPSLKNHVVDSLTKQFKEKGTLSPKTNPPSQPKKAKDVTKQKQNNDVTPSLQIPATTNPVHFVIVFFEIFWIEGATFHF